MILIKPMTGVGGVEGVVLSWKPMKNEKTAGVMFVLVTL